MTPQSNERTRLYQALLDALDEHSSGMQPSQIMADIGTLQFMAGLKFGYTAADIAEAATEFSELLTKGLVSGEESGDG